MSAFDPRPSSRARVELPARGDSWMATWVLVLFSALVAIVLALDVSGYANLMVATVLLVATLFFLVFIELVRVPQRVRRHGAIGVARVAVLLGAFPLGSIVGARLLNARVHWNRDRYQAIAARLRAEPSDTTLLPDEKSLAYSVSPVWSDVDGRIDRLPAPGGGAGSAPGRLVGVSFLVVTHGFAGHVTLLRIFDPEAERSLASGDALPAPWVGVRRLQPGWLLAFD